MFFLPLYCKLHVSGMLLPVKSEPSFQGLYSEIEGNAKIIIMLCKASIMLDMN